MFADLRASWGGCDGGVVCGDCGVDLSWFFVCGCDCGIYGGGWYR